MKRRLAIACVTLVLAALPVVAACAPLSDVMRGDWAYQAIVTLAGYGIIDGYPDGTFKGDRPLTRNEMAVLTARTIAKVEADGATKADLQDVQQLIDALKDELDALGVRVTDIEEKLGSIGGSANGSSRPIGRAVLPPPGLYARSQSPRSIAPRRKIDRPPTRDETAALITREIANVETDSTKKTDIEKTQRMLDGLKRELDTLGVRITNAQEVLAAPRARRAKLARRSSLHVDVLGEVLPSASSSKLANFPTHFDAPDVMLSSLAGLEFRVADGAAKPLSFATQELSTKNAALPVALHGLSDLYFWVPRVDFTPFHPAKQTVSAPSAQLRFGAPALAFPQSLAYERVFDLDVRAIGGTISNTVFGIDVAVPSVTLGSRDLSVAASLPESMRMSSMLGGHSRFGLPATTLNPAANAAPLLRLTDDLPPSSRPDAGPAFAPSRPAFVIPTFGYASPIFNPRERAPNSYSPLVPSAQGLRLNMAVPLRLGGLLMHGDFGVVHLQGIMPNSVGVPQYCASGTTNCAFAWAQRGSDDQLSAATALDVRALGRRITLNLGGSYERFSRPGAIALPYVPYDPTTQSLDAAPTAAALPGATVQTFNPNYVNLLSRTVNATAAVPLTPDLILNLQYNTQYYTGSYDALAQNIDERKDFYVGNLTYTIPRTSNSIVFSAKQYHYRDAFVPAYNLTQNRADLNFTIKF